MRVHPKRTGDENYRLALKCYKLGHYKKAMKYMKYAVRMGFNSPTNLQIKGWIQNKLDEDRKSEGGWGDSVRRLGKSKVVDYKCTKDLDFKVNLTYLNLKFYLPEETLPEETQNFREADFVLLIKFPLWLKNLFTRIKNIFKK